MEDVASISSDYVLTHDLPESLNRLSAIEAFAVSHLHTGFVRTLSTGTQPTSGYHHWLMGTCSE